MSLKKSEIEGENIPEKEKIIYLEKNNSVASNKISNILKSINLSKCAKSELIEIENINARKKQNWKKAKNIILLFVMEKNIL